MGVENWVKKYTSKHGKKKKAKVPTKQRNKTSIVVYDDGIACVLTEYRGGKLEILEAYTMKSKNHTGGNSPYLSTESLGLMIEMEGKKRKKSPGVGVSILFSHIRGNEKVLKYPPLDKGTVQELISQSYLKFYGSTSDGITINGTEYLGDMGVENGELYYVISTVPKQKILDACVKLEKGKIPLDAIYSEVLALRNILTAVKKDEAVKCLVHTRGDRAHVLITRNNTLVFHKEVAGENKGGGNTNINRLMVTAPTANYGKEAEEQREKEAALMNVLPDIARTLDYVAQKEGIVVRGVIISGDLLHVHDVEEVVASELGVEVEKLNLTGTTNAIEIVNLTANSRTADYTLPIGLALRGVMP